MHLKMSSVKWRPFWLGLNVLIGAQNPVLQDFFYKLMLIILNIPWKQCQHRICWWPGFLCYQPISQHDVDNISSTHPSLSWWRHQMETFSALLAICAGNSPGMRGIHRSPVNSPHKGQWRGALMFSLIYTRIHGWVNTGEAGDLRCHHAHYDVIVMLNTCNWVLISNVNGSRGVTEVQLSCNLILLSTDNR